MWSIVLPALSPRGTDLQGTPQTRHEEGISCSRPEGDEGGRADEQSLSAVVLTVRAIRCALLSHQTTSLASPQRTSPVLAPLSPAMSVSFGAASPKFSTSGSGDKAPLQLDAMEAALDGIETAPEAAAHFAEAARRADADPQQIMLALRGLPLFPEITGAGSAISTTPEAAFITAGGPTCLLREVMLPPYPHESAPLQLYAGMDRARRLQNQSDFKAAIAQLELVLRVWRLKHLWKLLREEPSLDLAQGLEEDVRRTEERRLRALYREEERKRQEEEEAEFARKMAESGTDGGGESGGAADDAPKSRAHSDSDSESDSDSDSEDEDGEPRNGASKHGSTEEQKHHHHHHHHNKAAAAAALEPEEVLEFPAVSPEEELEFLVYYYNTLGAVYQSAAASGSQGGATKRVTSAGGDGTGGIRWGRMKVIPCPADDPSIREMIVGTKSGAALGDRMGHGGHHRGQSAAAAAGHAYSAQLNTPFIEEEVAQDGSNPDEDYIASSPADLSNNSCARALIALWQAKRAHDLYVQLKEDEKARALAVQRAAEAAARGPNAGGLGEDDDDDRAHSSMGDNSSPLSPTGASAAATTLGRAAFATVNTPNMTLDAMQAEAKALGLFSFPHLSQNGSSVAGKTAASAVAKGGSAEGVVSLQAQDRANNLLFWSTQPILVAAPKSKHASHGSVGAHLESTKSLASVNAAAGSPNAAGAAAASGAPASSAAAPGSAASIAAAFAAPPISHAPAIPKLISPYIYCSAADALTYSNLGTCLFHLGNYPLALRCFFVSLQIRAAVLRPSEDEYVDVANSLNNLGVVLSALGFFGEAWSYFEAAVELAKARLDPIHPRLNILSNNLIKIEARRSRIASAPGVLQQLRAIATRKENKEIEARDKKLAKAAKKGAKGKGKDGKGAGASRPGTSASARPGSSASKQPGKKDEPPPKEFHEDNRFFAEPVVGQPPIGRCTAITTTHAIHNARARSLRLGAHFSCSLFRCAQSLRRSKVLSPVQRAQLPLRS